MSSLSTHQEIWQPSRGKVGMAALIGMECFFFSGFIVAYLYYIGASAHGPFPRDVLEVKPVIVNSVALLSSSWTVVAAVRALNTGRVGSMGFWLLITVLLGTFFIWGTLAEWRTLIYDKGLTISTNLFGSTFFALIGFHAFHVCLGLMALSTVWVLGVLGQLKPSRDAMRLELISWYWHFVDVVWIFVFTTVYIVGMRP